MHQVRRALAKTYGDWIPEYSLLATSLFICINARAILSSLEIAFRWSFTNSLPDSANPTSLTSQMCPTESFYFLN
jgi:hypothetical protein